MSEKVYVELEEVKTIAEKSISKLSNNLDNLNELETKTKDLKAHSSKFKSSSIKLNRIMKCKNIRIKLIIMIGLVLVLGLFALSLYLKFR